MNNIIAGTVVQLKSGGPLMTVRWLEGGEAYCEWFDANSVKGAKFVFAQLLVSTDG